MVTLADVKDALGITGTYQDATLTVYMNEVVDFLKDSGVAEANITAGIVARGVSDLWDYGSGTGKQEPESSQHEGELFLHGAQKYKKLLLSLQTLRRNGADRTYL